MSADHQTTSEISREALIAQLQFLRTPNWLADLLAKSNKDRVAIFEKELVMADPGIGYCIDERRLLVPMSYTPDSEAHKPKPGFVGGAAGWMVMFMATGKTLPQALDLTRELYINRGWGRLEAHIDDEHGHIPAAALGDRSEGCGFLGKWQDVVGLMQEVLGEQLTFLQPVDKTSAPHGTEFIQALRRVGAEIVPLTGNHNLEQAAVVVNLRAGKTLNRHEIFGTHPAFVWDAWATTHLDTLGAFNSLAGVQMTQEQFMKMQVAMHLATGYLLNALRVDGSNFVLLNNGI